MELIKKITDLKDTVGLMTSQDYKKRFKAEYVQLYIRTKKLSDMLYKLEENELEENELEFTLACSKDTLYNQLFSMINYLKFMEQRSVTEGISMEYEEGDEIE